MAKKKLSFVRLGKRSDALGFNPSSMANMRNLLNFGKAPVQRTGLEVFDPDPNLPGSQLRQWLQDRKDEIREGYEPIEPRPKFADPGVMVNPGRLRELQDLLRTEIQLRRL